MAQILISLDTEILQGLFSKDGKDEAFSRLLEVILNQVLAHQAEEQLQAAPYERQDNRVDYRNGYRERIIKTRIGSLRLSVPRFRHQKFTTDLFKRYQRSEQALILSMLEMVINGVSTRKIRVITEELCGTSFSKSTISSLCKILDPVVEEFRNRRLDKHYPFVTVDAIYTKVRYESKVRSVGLFIAIGISESGHREILGFSVFDKESEYNWKSFFQELKKRGLENIDIITSDNHFGLVKAIRSEFIGTSWQRCQTHFSKNMINATPKSLQPKMSLWLKSLYNAIDMSSARKIKDEMFTIFGKSAIKAMNILEAGFDDILTVLNLPFKYRKRLRTTNNIERLNEEIRRRERVIRIFPNEYSVIRLLGSLLMEYNEK